MSILIRGMEMPKNCDVCNFDAGGYCTAKSLNFLDWCNVNERPRPSWCPLIELPPHGDLIDRDALMKDGWLSLHKEVMRMGGYAIHELPLINPTIPVVIEKENC